VVGETVEKDMFEKFASSFEAETGIHVRITLQPWGNYKTKLLTALAAQLNPDCAMVVDSDGSMFGSYGVAAPLDKEFPEAAKQWQAALLDGLYESSAFRGHIYGVPIKVNSQLIYFRKDVFAQLGLEPPRTLEELYQTAMTLTANDYWFGYGWSRNTSYGLYPFLWSLGMDFVDDRTHMVNWDDPRFREAFRYAVRLWNLPNQVTNQERLIGYFLSNGPGNCMPLYVDGLWRYTMTLGTAQIKTPDLIDQIGVCCLPGFAGKPAFNYLGRQVIVIFENSRHKEATIQWLQYITSQAIQTAAFNDATFGRGDRSNISLPVVKDFWRLNIPMAPYNREVISQSLNEGNTPPFQFLGDSQMIMDQIIDSISESLSSHMSLLAREAGLSDHDLRRAFAQGRYPELQAKHECFLEELTNAKLDAKAEAANHSIEKAIHKYETQVANVIGNLDFASASAKTDILKILLRVVLGGALVVFATLAVLRSLRRHLVAYVFIAPPVLTILIFTVIPLLTSVYIGLTAYVPFWPLSTAKFIGLENFREVLEKQEVLKCIGRTLYFAVLVVPIQLIIALVLSSLINSARYGTRLFKFLFFAPLVTSIVSVALVWSTLLSSDRNGWVNHFLLLMGLVDNPVQFLTSSRMFLNSTILMSIWHGLAFTIVILIAGHQNIPNELYEAASIDGANALKKFRHITIPSLQPQVLFLTVVGTIGALQVFEQIYILAGKTGGNQALYGPGNSGLTMVAYVYSLGFEQFQMSQATVVAYILFAVIMVFTMLGWKVMTRGVAR
jgi:ABC-type sugar transport system permease subunit/ABC-type glycerol-3-phosphate transport system substrate-binding protein